MKSFEARKPFRILAGLLALVFWPATFFFAKIESGSILEMTAIVMGGSIFSLVLTSVALTGKIPALLRSVFYPAAWNESKHRKGKFF